MCVGHLTGGGRSVPRLIDGGPPKHRDHAPALLPSSSFSFQASWPSTSKLSSCPPSSPCVGECIVGVRAAFGRRWAVPARARASLCCCAACVSCCVPVLFVGVIKPAVSGLVRGHQHPGQLGRDEFGAVGGGAGGVGGACGLCLPARPARASPRWPPCCHFAAPRPDSSQPAPGGPTTP